MHSHTVSSENLVGLMDIVYLVAEYRATSCLLGHMTAWSLIPEWSFFRSTCCRALVIDPQEIRNSKVMVQDGCTPMRWCPTRGVSEHMLYSFTFHNTLECDGLA